jgi:hypothetical protein
MCEKKNITILEFIFFLTETKTKRELSERKLSVSNYVCSRIYLLMMIKCSFRISQSIVHSINCICDMDIYIYI